MATQYVCPADRCSAPPNETKTRRGIKVCARCGAASFKREGAYSVVVWRGDGRYLSVEPITTYQTEKAAYAYVDRSERTDLVVRFL